MKLEKKVKTMFRRTDKKETKINHYKIGCVIGLLVTLALLNLTSNILIILNLKEAKPLLMLTFILNIFATVWGVQEIKYRFNKAMGE